MTARRRIQVASVGFDDFRQTYGGDPFNNASNVGLRVPLLATPTPKSDLRYLFCLCSYEVPAGACVRVTGFRQMLTIGMGLTGGVSGTYPLEQPVVTPAWSFPDGNVSWHLRTFAQGQVPPTASGPLDSLSFVYRWRPGPALLYKTATFPVANLMPNGHPDSYLPLTSYTPPNKGQPYGDPLCPEFGTFYDIRNPWNGVGSDLIDVPVRGPVTIAFFASVKQTHGFNLDGGQPTRPYPPRPPWPTVANTYPNAFIPEESFVQTFELATPHVYANYWRVGGAFTVEDEG